MVFACFLNVWDQADLEYPVDFPFNQCCKFFWSFQAHDAQLLGSAGCRMDTDDHETKPLQIEFVSTRHVKSMIYFLDKSSWKEV
jgi:hypothetical protein